VALPYDFDWRLSYDDPAVRAAVRADVLAWVARYRSHPALRMWALGNEVFHKIVPPSWCPGPVQPEHEASARAFASFYVELIDQVHQLDPNHPVIYRASEDSYITWLQPLLAQQDRQAWFAYGLNVYTARLEEVLETWPGFGLDLAVLVSEFAPGPESRPDGYRDFWATILRHKQFVVGGAAYVWFAEGPEAIDLVYGLVGPDGAPLDGAFAVIREIYQGGSSTPR
jgi:hypothetical protein